MFFPAKKGGLLFPNFSPARQENDKNLDYVLQVVGYLGSLNCFSNLSGLPFLEQLFDK